MRVRPMIAAAAVAALSITALAFSPDPNTVNTVTGDAARDGNTVAFAGFANLIDKGVEDVYAGGMTPFADRAAGDALGIDLVGGSIGEYGGGEGLRFTWDMTSLPPEGVPEGTRYTWTFLSGGEQFQLQVKRTNMASVTTTESPVDHAAMLADTGWWFQLRGACTTNYANENSPVSGYYHLGFFDGSVDTATGTISMDVPYRASDAIGRKVAETFKPGTPITAFETAGSSIAASVQAVVSNATTTQAINGWGSYVPGVAVSVALGNASGPTGAYAAIDTAGDGSFAGSLSGAGSHVWVQACTGYQLPPLTDACPVSSIAVG